MRWNITICDFRCACVTNEFNIITNGYSVISSLFLEVSIYAFMLTMGNREKASFLGSPCGWAHVILLCTCWSARTTCWEAWSYRSWLLSLFTRASAETSVPLSSKHAVQTNIFSQPLLIVLFVSCDPLCWLLHPAGFPKLLLPNGSLPVSWCTLSLRW